jgi:hypothetical protein
VRKNSNFLSIALIYDYVASVMGFKIQEKPPVLQNMKFKFSFLWAFFAFLNPDPIRIRIRNTDA